MSDTQPFVEKYRPEGVTSVQGHNKDIKELRHFIENYSQGDTPQLIEGGPGIGKTSSINAIAGTLGLPVKEINASDARKSDDIEEICEDARIQPISADMQIVMFDEVDSMSGRTNLDPLYELMDDSPNPLVFICNEAYKVPSGIRRKCNERKFNLGTRSIKAKLKEVAEQENIDLDAVKLTKLSERNSLRDALGDLQTISEGQELREDDREYDESVFDVLDEVIRGRPGNFSEAPPTSLHWIDHNIRDRWRLIEASAAWDALSRSDVWLGRTPAEDRYWWKYAALMQEQVPYLRLSEAWDGYIPKERPAHFKQGKPDSKERELYHELSGTGGGTMDITCDFLEFRTSYLPILQDLTDDEICEIGVEHGLSPDLVAVLGVTPGYFEKYKQDGEAEPDSRGGNSGESGVEEQSFLGDD